MCRARLEQHAKYVHSSLVSPACGSRHDINGLTGPTALLASLPPSVCSCFYTSLWALAVVSLSLCGTHSITCLRAAFGQMLVAAGMRKFAKTGSEYVSRHHLRDVTETLLIVPIKRAGYKQVCGRWEQQVYTAAQQMLLSGLG